MFTQDEGGGGGGFSGCTECEIVSGGLVHVHTCTPIHSLDALLSNFTRSVLCQLYAINTKLQGKH